MFPRQDTASRVSQKSLSCLTSLQLLPLLLLCAPWSPAGALLSVSTSRSCPWPGLWGLHLCSIPRAALTPQPPGPGRPPCPLPFGQMPAGPPGSHKRGTRSLRWGRLPSSLHTCPTAFLTWLGGQGGTCLFRCLSPLQVGKPLQTKVWVSYVFESGACNTNSDRH